MKYIITESNPNRGTKKILRSKDLRNDAEASEWFTDQMAEWLGEDDTGNYRYESYLPMAGGEFFNEGTQEIEESLPPWWKGEGWYDESDNLIMKYAVPRDGSFEDITSLEMHGLVYRLEKETYLRTAEVAKVLGVTRQTVYAMARRGEIKSERIANRWMYLKSEVDAMLP